MKKWYTSKTYWFNIGLGIVGILEANLHLVQNSLGDVYGYVLMGVGIVGMMLRNITTTSIDKGVK